MEEAYQHAQVVGLQLLAVMREALTDLDRVKRIVKILGMVNGTPDFTQFPQVINGCSDLFALIFGDAGKHARSAIGVGGLPGNATVEIEIIAEIV